VDGVELTNGLNAHDPSARIAAVVRMIFFIIAFLSRQE
jgi:hypothetical protein